ncbi:MAG TPA: NAD-dependent epimerase/dehydratase family protein [Hyphomicrobiaceae bacterium]|nr:NAD-dependent epimerase/dehydratase family protein [Hyphomicrobiaceae bacterium]
MLNHLQATPTPPKRCLVVGAGGFIGSSIVEALTAARVPVLGLTREDVDLLSGDGVPKLAAHLAPTDAVIFAAAVAPTRSASQLVDNLRMAETAIAAFARTPPAHLLYLSSDAVYGENGAPLTETSPVAPSSLHGMMHAARELMFRSSVKAPFAALRPALIYGAADPHAAYGPNRFRRQAAAGEPISLFGEGEEKRDHVAVEDVADLAVRMVLHRSIGILNAATGVATSFRTVAELIARQHEPPASVVAVPRSAPPPRPLHRFFDIAACHKAFPDFHFEPLERGLARVHRACRSRAGEVARG